MNIESYEMIKKTTYAEEKKKDIFKAGWYPNKFCPALHISHYDYK